VISAPPVIDQRLVRYDPASEPKKTVNLQVVAFTLLGLAGAGGLSLAGAPVAAHHAGAAAGAKRSSGKVTPAKVNQAKVAGGSGADGDNSRTWRWPGTAWLDASSVAAPTWLATRPPLLARVLRDASYLRAMSGSLSLVLPLAGVALGALAVGDVHGHGLAPSLGLVTAIAVLGVLDAAAGLVAVLVFMGGIAALGLVTSADSVRLLGREGEEPGPPAR